MTNKGSDEKYSVACKVGRARVFVVGEELIISISETVGRMEHDELGEVTQSQQCWTGRQAFFSEEKRDSLCCFSMFAEFLAH